MRPRVWRSASVTLQRFIPLIATESPTALVPGALEPRMYPRSGYFLVYIYFGGECEGWFQAGHPVGVASMQGKERSILSGCISEFLHC